MFGQVTNPKNQVLKDLSLREFVTLFPLVIMAFWIGIYPKPFFKIIEKPVNQIVERVQPGFHSRPLKQIEQHTGGEPVRLNEPAASLNR